ncbi:class I SAM-dependent methyltransferase [Streptomyces sp. NPDC006649]|uniref:class I SAM-dependent methyltransferase n=1 Tax=unclassified Streptomyces TaxID=2593676 RepID=UPI003246394D
MTSSTPGATPSGGAPANSLSPAGTEQLPAPAALDDVKGWFFAADQLLFDWLLTRQKGLAESGDLLEVGTYLGKSAIFTGSYLRPGERFTVCDLFDAPADDSANGAEMAKSYSTLTRRAFEANYLSFHDALPTVLQGLSSMVSGQVAEGSCRFVHVDASHLYAHVHADIATARAALKPYGVVVLDDFRAEHCPGVAAAAWQAVTSGGLHVICITGTKLYGTWGDPTALRTELAAWLATRTDLWHGEESVAGEPLIRISGKKARLPRQPVSRHPAPPRTAASRTPGPAGTPGGHPALRRFTENVLPPFLTKAATSARRRG